jgi:MraZ protein
MKSFIGTFENKIDAKGRISVPATFRAVLNAKSLNSVICYSSLTGPCIEGCGLDRIESMVDKLPDQPVLDDSEDTIAHLIFSSARELPFDTGGRIILPSDFIAKAKIFDYGAFVGKGKTFQIWNPKELKIIQSKMFERFTSERRTLMEEI